jgi:hypothetical protein
LRTAGRVETDLGNAQPDWLGGFANTFKYKGFNLYALVDIRQGGVIFSQSNREQIIYGTSKKTLEGRDGTYVAEGMVGQKRWIRELDKYRNKKQQAGCRTRLLEHCCE